MSLLFYVGKRRLLNCADGICTILVFYDLPVTTIISVYAANTIVFQDIYISLNR